MTFADLFIFEEYILINLIKSLYTLEKVHKETSTRGVKISL